MALSGRVIGRKDVPHEAGEWFEFATISGMQLDEARQSSVREAMQLLSGGATLPNITQQPDAAPPNPEDSYDKNILVKYGVVAWSYPESCDLTNKTLLDARTRDWAAHEVFAGNVYIEGEGQASDSR